MRLLRSIIISANACTFAPAFAPIMLKATVQPSAWLVTPLRETTETEAEKLLRQARELREAVKESEDELHSTLIQRKKTRDTATDAKISYLFPGNVDDGARALCDRLRRKRLASDMLVRIVERLHEREVAARGLEHVEPSVHRDRVTFERVAEPDETELGRIRGLVSRLIEAAEVLDREFIEEKSECGETITHSDIMHWGGGDIAGILRDKAKELGREHDEQFQKRLNSFYEAAKRKHGRSEVDKNEWKNDDVWSP